MELNNFLRICWFEILFGLMLNLICDCDKVDTLVSTQPSTQSDPVAVLWPNWQDPGKMSSLAFHLRYTQSQTNL